MPAQADEIEHEFDVALLRLGGHAGQQPGGSGGECDHNGDQSSKHVGLLNVQAGLLLTPCRALQALYRHLTLEIS
jgi:hypothetical protein